MTLSKQLLLSGIFLLICLFLGMLFYVVDNTQTFIDHQLAKHAEDTATSLGLSLSLAMEENEFDVPVANRIVDAVWDSGYYRKILVTNIDGEIEIERQLNVRFYKVPDWFIEFIELKTREERAKIQSGWLQQGEVIVQSNPGFAYQQIWKTINDFLKWLAVTAILAAAIGGSLLYIILKPLRAVTRQANAICNQQFVEESLPWTFDLRQVVVAMNNMSRRLKRLFEEQAQETERLKEEAFISPVTRLANRRYFDVHFDHILVGTDVHTGVGLLIEVHNFKGYNDKHGYEAGDELLKTVADQIKAATESIENSLVAHLGGASFIIILQDKIAEVGVETAQALCDHFQSMMGRGLSKESDVAHVGVSAFQTNEAKKEILSKLDMALRQAQSKGANEMHLLKHVDESDVHGAQDWAKIFDDAIRNKDIILFFQKVVLLHAKQAFYEALMRIKRDGKILSAGMFMPMAERLNRIVELDKAMISELIYQIENSKETYQYFVNISPTSIDDPDFVKWLLEKIKLLSKRANQFIIELPEYGVISRIDEVRDLFFKASKLGAKTSIEHYGKNLSSFAYLNNLRLNFLKIDGSFVRNVHENEDNQFLIKSLVEIAKRLDISVIAEAVEVEEEYNKLLELKVDGVQGYYIGKPMEGISQ